jgi:hypothetical protein
MSVVLVIIILMAWLVILGPNLMKRRSRAAGGINSISHFHRQLRVLEHSAPQTIVTPAYRLRAVDGSSVPPQGTDGSGTRLAPKLSVVGADQLPRPALAFLGQDPPGSDSDTDAGPDDRSVGGTHPGPDLADSGASGTGIGPADAPARSRVRRRRQDTLGVLALVFGITILIGFIPGATAAWAVSLVSGLVLTAYVALLVRLRQRAEERQRKLRYLHPEPAGAAGHDGAPASGAPSIRVSGRYAHPSNQVAAAR